jgi:hypothetical protein
MAWYAMEDGSNGKLRTVRCSKTVKAVAIAVASMDTVCCVLYPGYRRDAGKTNRNRSTMEMESCFCLFEPFDDFLMF